MHAHACVCMMFQYAKKKLSLQYNQWQAFELSVSWIAKRWLLHASKPVVPGLLCGTTGLLACGSNPLQRMKMTSHGDAMLANIK